jgi:hypothetical protein
MKYNIIKNKIGIPFRAGSIDLIYGKGFDTVTEIIDLSIDLGLVSVAGAWYSYEGYSNVQGKQEFHNLITTDENIMKSLREQILKILNLTYEN